MALLKPNAGGALRRRTARRWVAWFCLVALFSTTAATARAETAISAENQVKAVFLFNFTQFVKWPASAFAEAQSPIVIGVLGEDPFGAYLEGLVQGEKIGERLIVVRRFQHAEELTACHILFISRSEAAQLEAIFDPLKNRSVLTVGDVENFNRLGGMVRLATEGGKIQLRINVTAAKTADLTISSKLLAHAVIVSPGKN